MKYLVRQRANLEHPVGYRTTTPAPTEPPARPSGPPPRAKKTVFDPERGNPLHECLVARARREAAAAKPKAAPARVAALPRFAAASSLPRFKASATAPKPKADLHVDLASKIRLERAGMGEAAIRRAVESAAAAKPRKPLTAAQLDIATRELMRRQPQLGYFAARDLIRRNG